MPRHLYALTLLVTCSVMAFAFLPSAAAQAASGEGVVKQVYQDHCAVCHGETLKGGIGPSLIDEEWTNGSSAEAIMHSISAGYLDREMPGFSEILSEDVIRSLVIYIAEERSLARVRSEAKDEYSADRVYETQYQKFQLERVYEYEGEIWGLESLPDGSFLATDRKGPLLLISEDGKTQKIKKTPDVWHKIQGGMMDVRLHPEYLDNGWIYLGFSAPASEDKSRGMTRLVRGRVKNGCWEDQEIIFQSKPEHETAKEYHFGTRIEFQDGYVFFSVGDRGDPDNAQDLSWPSGKIHRLHDDGRIPEDNPFVAVENAYPSIFSYGHRNPQGMILGQDGALYISEHGPRGGDEVNHPEIGKNYGWPVITHGMNYDGTPMTAKTEMDGMEQPLHYWVPSIATAGITSVFGDVFPSWSGDILVAGLQSQELHRLRLDDGKVIEDEIILQGIGRVRDVAMTADGSVYVVINNDTFGPSTVYRLMPSGA